MMSKIKTLSICFLICTWMLTGCAQQVKVPETVEENTLWVDKEGTVRLYLVDMFDEKAYFDVSELTRMAMEEAEKYNKANADSDQKSVVVEKVERSKTDGRIRVNYTFKDGKAFSGFQFLEGTLFYGTVKEAAAAGYSLGSVALVNAKDGSMTTGAAVESSAADKHVLITDQKLLIYCPYQVTHVGEGAVCREDGTVDTTKAQENVFILMKQ
ncbi:MAG: hypothetical protein NC126_11915 [Clostridium sp.]|nr:hypothetical protein [Clostridium sp.]